MKGLKWLAAGVVLLLAGGAIFQGVAGARDRKLNPPPGRLIDAGGYRMHLYCTGQGPHTVILDAGLGDSFVSWSTLQPQIAGFARVCSYDRAGMGFSEPGRNPRTSKVIAEELHAVLQNAAIPPPYVLAGHSFGGFNVREYASLYPKEVAGMVLVDASHPQQLTRMPAELNQYQSRFTLLLRLLQYSAPFGIPRIIGFCDMAPPETRAMQRTVQCSARPLEEAQAETSELAESAAQVQQTGPFGAMPLRVLSHDPEKLFDGIPPEISRRANVVWDQLQQELAGLSTNSTRIIAKGSGHYIHQEQPALVLDAIRDVIRATSEAPGR